MVARHPFRGRFQRKAELLILGALGAALSSCSEVEVGPLLDTPEPVSNACLDLSSADSSSLATPEGLLAVFDCFNSEQSFSALRSPLAYLVEAHTLDPYFLIPDYLAPLQLETYSSGGDLQLTIQSLEALINDPQQPLEALLYFYVELEQNGLLGELLWLSQLYTGYLYEGCASDIDTCQLGRLLDLASDLYFSEDVAVLKDLADEQTGTVDPVVMDAIVSDLLSIVRQTTRAGSPTGENLFLGMTEAMIVTPLEPDPSREVDDPYSSQGYTLLQALQKPLCQLRSDRDTIDGILALSSTLSSTGQDDYLPLYLRTLVNISPYDEPRTTDEDTSDSDDDGFSIADGDCDDTNAAAYPNAAEVVDRIDNDCDLVADISPSKDDQDGDRVSPNAGDCDDTDSAVHPGLKIYESNGGITIIDRAPEVLGDGIDNDCDGFADRVPSSLDILLKSGTTLLPMLYGPYDEDKSVLEYALETMVNTSGTSLDLEAMLEDNDALIQSIVSNYTNGTLPPDITALVRVSLPVAYVLADMGLLSTSSLGAVQSIWQDHLDYEDARANATGSELQRFTQFQNACGEDFELYVDTVSVLEELVRIVDAYQVINEPNLLELIPIVVNSDLLLDLAKMPSTPAGDLDPAVIDAALNLFDYFMKPPADSGLYSDVYSASHLWELVPMAHLLWTDSSALNTIDRLLQYALDGMDDPSSPLNSLKPALEALAEVETGATMDTQGLLENILVNPDVRPILANFLAIPADQTFNAIFLGEWDRLTTSQQSAYRTEESTAKFMTRWIQEGVISRLIDLAGYMLEWIVDNTGLGDPIESAAETTPTPSPTVTPGP